jgi:putative SOS response-associated peptidase YedK
MCGRFTLRNPNLLQRELFQLTDIPALPQRFNIAPTQTIAAVRQLPSSKHRELALVRWGLVPSWAQDPKIGNTLINGRSETAATKPAFRSAFKARRCLIPADGFYEWHRTADGKQPYYIHRRDNQPFAFAGLWERWHDPNNGELETATILTTDANDLMRPIHNRMPVILRAEDYDRWLDPGNNDRQLLEPLLKPGEPKGFEATAVSTYVNSPRHDDARCVEPVEPTTQAKLF